MALRRREPLERIIVAMPPSVGVVKTWLIGMNLGHREALIRIFACLNKF